MSWADAQFNTKAIYSPTTSIVTLSTNFTPRLFCTVIMYLYSSFSLTFFNTSVAGSFASYFCLKDWSRKLNAVLSVRDAIWSATEPSSLSLVMLTIKLLEKAANSHMSATRLLLTPSTTTVGLLGLLVQVNDSEITRLKLPELKAINGFTCV